MKHITFIGLGNPGIKYSSTRHNVGFLILDKLASEHGVAFQDKGTYHIATIQFAGRSITLVKPYTSMNVSGKPLIQLVSTMEHMIAIYDDLDLDFAKVKMKKAGSGSGGHNGVKSLIECLGNKFDRVKVGIGKPAVGTVLDWVLGNLTDQEKTDLDTCYSEVVIKLESLIQDYDREMSKTSKV